MKRKLTPFVILLLFLLFANSVYASNGNIYSAKISNTSIAKKPTISLNKTKVTITVKKSLTLTAKATPKAKVTWSSSNTNIATVSSAGKITAKRVGTCTITAKANGVKTTCKVTVKAASAVSITTYKQITEESSPTINQVTYSQSYNRYSRAYTIYKMSGGVKSILVSNSISYVSLTNGKYLFYAREGYNINYLYRYDLTTGETKYITSLYRACPLASDGTYLYYGCATQYGGVISNLQVYNLNTGKNVSVGADASNMYEVNGKIIVSAQGRPHGGALGIMNKDGSSYKKIGDQNVSSVTINGNYIYFNQIKITWERRKCRCDLNGNNVTVLENWHGGII